ncbi:MAG TPA: ribosome-associated translation inhibitor RaiA [Alphaproteobacteria bacterium]|nr:ribosome-associated translation inhibitor RaiA [Alphaproteobacteria bacterium]
MSIVISGKQMEMGESLKSHIATHLNDMAAHYMLEIIEGSAVVEKFNHSFKMNVSVQLAHNLIIRAHGEDSDAYKACDVTLEKIAARLKRYKNRLRDKKRHKDSEVYQASRYIVNSHEEDVGHDSPAVVAEMKENIPTFSVSEAVMHLDLSDSPVVMFKNPNSGVFNVVYRRQDGNVGWIAPQN